MSSGKVLLGVLAGTAIGALLGILFAPEKGKVTRKKIRRKSKVYTDSIKDKVDELIEVVTENLEKVKDDVSDFVEKGKAKVEDQITEEINDVKAARK